MKPLEQRIGRKMYAYEKIYQFSTGEHIFTRGTGLGVIESVTDKEIGLYQNQNPVDYRHYTMDREKVEKWLKTGECKIR